MANQFDIPILYTVFNRLDLVKQTFPEIQKIKPKQLFIGADGPRNKEEKIKTDEVRKYLLENINWKCKVKTLFLDKNLGANIATFKEINWFFKNVEKGIILEDDNLPNHSFFAFCREMLIKYEKNHRIMSICGFTPIKASSLKESYYFSKNFGTWGLATWRDRWQKTNLLSPNYGEIEKENGLSKIIKNPLERIVLRRRLRYNLIGGVKGWDFSFLFLHHKNNAICIKPKKNLIKNIGFGENSTITSDNFIDKNFLCLETFGIKFPLIHPNEIKINKPLSNKEFRTDILRGAIKRILVTIGIIKYNYRY